MKKLRTIYGVVILTTILCTSCGGNSMQSDAKELAELQCKITKVTAKIASGDLSATKETKKLTNEMRKVSAEISEKYNTPEKMKAFSQELDKESKECQECN